MGGGGINNHIDLLSKNWFQSAFHPKSSMQQIITSCELLCKSLGMGHLW